MGVPTDEKLLGQYIAGDVAAFELLVRRHAQEVHQFAARITSDSVAAEDVVQETFLQVHSAAKSFDPARRFKPWLFTIAANKARDSLRRKGRRREVPVDAYVGNDDESRQRFVQLFEADGAAPDDDLLLDEKRVIVRAVIEAMPSKLWEVLSLAYYHHFPYKDIGEILEIPLGTVKSRLHAAVTWFAEHYKEAVGAEAEPRS